MKICFLYFSAVFARIPWNMNPDCDDFSMVNAEACTLNCDSNLGTCLVACDPFDPDYTLCQRNCFDSHENCRDGKSRTLSTACVTKFAPGGIPG